MRSTSVCLLFGWVRGAGLAFAHVYIKKECFDNKPDGLPKHIEKSMCNNPVSHIVGGCRYLLDGTGSAADVRSAIIGSLLVLAVMAPWTIARYQRRNA